MTVETVPKVAIFTLTYDRAEYTERMLESLEQSTTIPYDHFIVDNGSRDATHELLERWRGRLKRVLVNDENRGISLASNQALDMIGDDYDYIVKMDNDCQASTEGWLEKLIEVCEADVSGIVLSPYVRGLEGGEFPGGYPRTEHTTIAGRPVGLTKHLGGICLLAPTAAYEGFRFPTAVPLHGNQDVLFSIHVRSQCGYRMGYVEDVIVDSMEGQLQYLRYPEYFAERRNEARQVYGETTLMTKLATPVRKIRLIRAMRKAGLSDRTVMTAAVDRVRRACGLDPRDKWDEGRKEWT